MMTHRKSSKMMWSPTQLHDDKIEMRPNDTEKPGIVEPEHDIETTSRPQRTRNIPLRFQNYMMGK